MINKNLEKTKLKDRAIVIKDDYLNCLRNFYAKKVQLDIIYIDPPYKDKLYINTIEKIQEYNLLKDDGIIILETDEEQTKKEIENSIKINYQVYDYRKYGRAYLVFLK